MNIKLSLAALAITALPLVAGCAADTSDVAEGEETEATEDELSRARIEKGTFKLYDDANASYQEGPFKRVPRPGLRNYLGHVTTTLEQMNHRELALGTRTRSGDQWDVWESVYSPRGADG